MKKYSIIKPDQTLQNNLMAFGFMCCPPNSLILGDNQTISNLTKGSDVLGLSGKTNVLDVFSREYSGDMVEIKGEGMLPFFVTPEHPVLASESKYSSRSGTSIEKPTWIKAKDLAVKKRHGYGHCLVVPKITQNLNIKNLDLTPFGRLNKGVMSSTEITLTENIAWLLGLYVADGFPSSSGIQFSLHEKQVNLINKINEISLTELNHPTSVYFSKISKCATVTIPSKILSRCFPIWCGNGAKNKKIPDFILFNKNKKLLKSFIDGYFLGDGCIATSKGTKHRTANTISKILALQLQLAFGSLNIYAHIYQVGKEGYSLIQDRRVHINTKYKINVNMNPKRNFITINDSNLIVPIRKKSISDYSGIVYNIRTGDNTYLLSNAVVHNCGEGWYPLIYEVLDGLQAIIDKNDNLNDVQVTEIKEKFGGLRIYLNYGTDEMFKIIENAEGRSYAVCETCGKPGKLHNVKGWYMTRCEECLKKEN